MAVALGPTSCPSGFVLKSMLLHNPEAQTGFVPKNSHHGGKNPALRAEKPYLALRSFFSGAQRRSALGTLSQSKATERTVFLPLAMSYIA